MAIRISAENQAYSTTVSVPSETYTVTWWAKVNVDRNGYSTMWEPGSTSGTSVYTQIGPASTGTNFEVHADPGARNLTNLLEMPVVSASSTAGWRCFAISQTAANGTLRVGYGTDPDNMSWSTVAAPTAGPWQTLRIGKSVWTGEWFNGSLASWKQWSSVLTDAEAVAELKQYEHVRTANFVRRFDFKVPQTVPSAGTGNLTAGVASPATVIGPDIPDTLTVPAINPNFFLSAL
jgi:hypothetical protein